MPARVTPTGLFFLPVGCVATTTRQRIPSGPTGTFGQSERLRAIWLCSPLLELIGGQVQTRLKQRMIEHTVFFATGHKGEANEIGEHGPAAILSIKP